MAKLSEVFDDFEAASLDTTLWNNSNLVTQENGYAELPASGTYASRLAFHSPARDFTQDVVSWEWTFTTSVAAGAEQFLGILDDPDTPVNTIEMGRFSTSLGYIMGSNQAFIPWSDVNHRYCRIRTTASQIFFETSSDGDTWVNPFDPDGIHSLPAWDLSNVYLRWLNGFFDGVGAGPMRIEQVNEAITSIDGDLSAELPAISGQLQGGLSNAGALSGSLGAVGVEMAGTQFLSGSMPMTLGALSVDMSGETEFFAEDVTVSVGPTRIHGHSVDSTVGGSADAGLTRIERAP